jgi:hypothetical protein
MAFRKQDSDYETILDLKAEIRSANGDIEALMSQLLNREKEFETARKALLRRADSPRNITSRPQLVVKAKEAASSKQRCDLIVHSLMHKVRAPGLNAQDWTDVEGALRGARKAG